LPERGPFRAGRAGLLLAGTAPLALAAGGAWAGVAGEPLGWAALVLGLVAGAGLLQAARPPSEAQAADSRERLLRHLIDQLPVTVWLEDWSPIRAMLEEARREVGRDGLADWLEEHRDARKKAVIASRVIHGNAAAMHLYGATTMTDFDTPEFDTMVTRESGAMVESVLGPLLDGERATVFDSIDQQALNGRVVSVRTALMITEGYEDSWGRILMVETDITQEVEANRKLSEGEASLRALLEEFPMAVWLEDWSSVRPRVMEIVEEAGDDLEGWIGAHKSEVQQLESQMEILYVNRAAIELYRADSANDLKHSGGASLMSMIDGPTFARQVQALAVEGLHHTVFEARHVLRRDDSLMDMRGTIVLMQGHTHDWSRVLIVKQEITEEVRAERQLAESERRYRELFENSPLPIWENDWSAVKRQIDMLVADGVVDLRAYLGEHPDTAEELTHQMQFVALNAAAKALYRVEDTAQWYENASVPLSPDERAVAVAMFLDFMEGKATSAMEASAFAFDGSTIEVKLSASLQEAHRDDWRRVVIIVQDVGAERQAMARIRSSEERHRELFEQSPLAIWEGDWSPVKREVDKLHDQGIHDVGAYLRARPALADAWEASIIVTNVNAAAVNLYAVPDRTELLAGRLDVPGTDEERDNFISVVAALDEGRFLFVREIMEVTFDDRHLHVRNTFHVPEAHRANWDRVILHAEDVSERHEAQVRIEESERRYRELFEQSPFAIWESDWSGVKRALDDLAAQGIEDPIAHVRSRGDLAAELNDAIVPIDMNDAAVRLYGFESREHALANDETVVSTRDEIDALVDIAQAFRSGQVNVQRDIVEETFDHRMIVVRTTTMVPQGAEADWKRVVSIIEDITEQQETHARIEASERRYRELFDQAPVGIRVDDWSHIRRRAERLFVAHGGRLADHLIGNRQVMRELCGEMRIVESNEGCLRIYGADGLEALRKQFIAELSEDMLDELARTLEQLVQGASSVGRGETAETLRYGGRIYTRGTVLIPDEYQRDWARVILTVEDVTEIRRTREAMESNERRYRELFDQSPVAIWVEDWSRVRERLESLGDEALAKIGDTPALLDELYDAMDLVDINEMGWRQRNAPGRAEMVAWSRQPLSPTGRPTILRLITGLLQGERRIELPDTRQVRLDGTIFVERAVTFVPPEFARDWRRVIHVRDDVTAEHEALRNLDESRSMMSLAQRMTSHGHFVYDTDLDRIIDASETIGKIFGIETSQFLTDQKSTLAFIHPEDRERVTEHLLSTARTFSPVDIEFRVLWPNGEVRHLHEQSEFMLNEQGQRINRRIGAIHDVTGERRTAEELRRARDDAERASRAKTEFLATISHELRTPLNAIIGFSEVILEGMFGPLENPRYTEYVRDINESGRHLLELINDILDLAKAEAGRLQLNEDIVNLRSVIEQSTKLFRERADRSGITLVAVAPRGLPRLRADTRKLRQVLLNLISNAVKFTPENGRIEVRGELREDGGVDIVVGDTGIGMSAEDMSRAFEVFGQVDSALNRRYEGTGLGLPLSRAVMQLHGGDLIMESELGHGTRVIARFPEERTEGERATSGGQEGRNEA
jgi:PAS domain S-box-containing protein